MMNLHASPGLVVLPVLLAGFTICGCREGDSTGGVPSAEDPALPAPAAPASPPGAPGPSGTPAAPAPSGAGGDQNPTVVGEPVVDEPFVGEPGVHLVGRFADLGNGAMAFEWSGSGMVAAFEGESVAVTLDDAGGNQFTVLVDGELRPTLIAQSGSNSYELANDLGAGPHQVEIYRRTEASFGTTVFAGFDFGKGALLAPPTPPPRRIEIVGDSISCGYGNEGASATCGFSADTENHYLTYGAIAARALGAEVVTIAWSGKGIIYNYDTDTDNPLPALYDRTLPNDAGSTWGFSVASDAVVVNLGTNDFSTDGDPTQQLFVDNYVALLERLREVYPEAFILCTVGPLLSGADLDAARGGIADAVATRVAAGDDAVRAWEMNIANDMPGCDYHPSVATHQALANALVSQLQTDLGW